MPLAERIEPSTPSMQQQQRHQMELHELQLTTKTMKMTPQPHPDAYVSPSANPTNLPPTPELRKQLFMTEADINKVVALGYDSDGYHLQMNEMDE
jgi:hypothetical protein